MRIQINKTTASPQRKNSVHWQLVFHLNKPNNPPLSYSEYSFISPLYTSHVYRPRYETSWDYDSSWKGQTCETDKYTNLSRIGSKQSAPASHRERLLGCCRDAGEVSGVIIYSLGLAAVETAGLFHPLAFVYWCGGRRIHYSALLLALYEPPLFTLWSVCLAVSLSDSLKDVATLLVHDTLAIS